MKVLLYPKQQRSIFRIISHPGKSEKVSKKCFPFSCRLTRPLESVTIKNRNSISNLEAVRDKQSPWPSDKPQSRIFFGFVLRIWGALKPLSMSNDNWRYYQCKDNAMIPTKIIQLHDKGQFHISGQ